LRAVGSSRGLVHPSLRRTFVSVVEDSLVGLPQLHAFTSGERIFLQDGHTHPTRSSLINCPFSVGRS
jgi:hypothetical protein